MIDATSAAVMPPARAAGATAGLVLAGSSSAARASRSERQIGVRLFEIREQRGVVPARTGDIAGGGRGAREPEHRSRAVGIARAAPARKTAPPRAARPSASSTSPSSSGAGLIGAGRPSGAGSCDSCCAASVSIRTASSAAPGRVRDHRRDLALHDRDRRPQVAFARIPRALGQPLPRAFRALGVAGVCRADADGEQLVGVAEVVLVRHQRPVGGLDHVARAHRREVAQKLQLAARLDDRRELVDCRPAHRGSGPAAAARTGSHESAW